MRAGEDDLDVLFEVADPGAFSPDYLADRRAAIGKFRAGNEAALAAWLGDGPPTWSHLYVRERRAQTIRLALAAAVLASLFSLVARLRKLGALEVLGFAV